MYNPTVDTTTWEVFDTSSDKLPLSGGTMTGDNNVFNAGQTFPGAGEDVTATGTWTPSPPFIVSVIGSGSNFQLNFTNTGNLTTFLTAAGLSTEAGTQTAVRPEFVFTAGGIDYTVAAQTWSYDPSVNFINWPATSVSPGVPSSGNLNLSFTAELEQDTTNIIAGTGIDFDLTTDGDLTITNTNPIRYTDSDAITAVEGNDNVFTGSNRFNDSLEIREGNNDADANPILTIK